MGNFRFYCCPKDLIKKEEIPEGWGLIYIDNKKIEVIIGPKSNVLGQDDTILFQANKRAENIMLISALRKMNEKKSNNMNYQVYTLKEND